MESEKKPVSVAIQSVEHVENLTFNDYFPETPLRQNLDLHVFTQDQLKEKRKRKLTEMIDIEDIASEQVDTSKNKPEIIEILDDTDSPVTDKVIIEALEKLDFEIDEKFKSVLKEHQIEGLQFLWDRVFMSKQGCLLAHSMGLGKSIQTIAFLITMYQYLKKDPSIKNPAGNRILLLAPLVTLSNWANEFQKWSIDNTENIIGEVFNFSEISNQSSNRISYLKYWHNEGGIMLMSYDSFRQVLTNPKLNENVKESYYTMLINPGPDVAILDEGHRIKNAASSIANLVYQIRTRMRICLTGYPLQNNLMEYYYMLDFVAPNLLGSKESFKASFKSAIEKCYADSPNSKKLLAAMKMYILQLLTNRVTHRRDDSILKAQLPKKYEYVIRFKMSPSQFDGYTKMLKYADVFETPLIGLIVLRALCNHPKVLELLLKRRHEKSRNKVLDKEYAAEKDEFYIDDEEINKAIVSIPGSEPPVDDAMDYNEEDIFENFPKTVYDWMKSYLNSPDIESWKCSGKMSFITDLAQNCHVMQEKLVIVSHSLACLTYIEQLLPIFGIKSLKIDGSTMGLKRQQIIDTFQMDPAYDVILLSAKAAAIGINLTAANRIVLVDQDWNPLYDEQSIGRVYRYGQEKSTHVYRLVTASTIEERIFMQGLHKKSISRRVIDNKASLMISKDELTEYYAPPDPNIPLIDIDSLNSSIKEDFIDSAVFRDNKSCINSCQIYENSNMIEENVSTWVEKLSEEDRRTAKNEAFDLFKKWNKSK